MFDCISLFLFLKSKSVQLQKLIILSQPQHIKMAKKNQINREILSRAAYNFYDNLMLRVSWTIKKTFRVSDA